jgi:virginiamycin B lyase
MFLLPVLTVLLSITVPIAHAQAVRITEFPIPFANSHPLGITAGPDGNLWFTDFNTDQIGRSTTRGAMIAFATPTLDSQPLGIIAGPNSTLWFTESNADSIGRMSTGGSPESSGFRQQTAGLTGSPRVGPGFMQKALSA